MHLGRMLQWATDQFGLDPRDEWYEYVAEVLLCERPTEGDLGVRNVSAGLQLLAGRCDPRTPVIMRRLISEEQYLDVDVVPALTCLRTAEARGIVSEIAAEAEMELNTAERRGKVALRQREKLQRLQEMLKIAKERLKATEGTGASRSSRGS